MNLLIDTHIYLWWLTDDKNLSKKVKNNLLSLHNDIFVSAASIWEISIKTSIGKLKIDGTLPEDVTEEGFKPLNITCQHAALAGNLPKHHADPFNRMLIAQAKIEDFTLVTHDKTLSNYDVELLVN